MYAQLHKTPPLQPIREGGMDRHEHWGRRWQKAFLLALFTLVLGAVASAQAPTSLQYPSPSVFISGESTVFLSPTVAGNVTSYSVSPALPAGLSLNTNTGVISGTPTATSGPTSYTVTATNASGTTTGTLSLQVTATYFNAAYDTLRFINSVGTITAIRGTGSAVNDSILYKNVITVSGQQIDCIVTTLALNNLTSFDAYDQEAASGTYFSSNMSHFFSPQFNFAGAGSARFAFHFILGSSYVNFANPGTPVVLQNVRINTYDIDGNGGASSNQYNHFSGFDSSELGSPTNITPTLNTTTALTEFHSGTNANTLSVVDDVNRVRLTYKGLTDLEMVVGADAGGLAYFFIDFSTGSTAFTTAVKTSAPSIDLNTNTSGVNNYASACTGVVNFTDGGGQTNVSSPTDPTFTQLRVSFPTASVTDAANEEILINGATAGGTITLNSDPNITNLTLGGIVYSAIGSTSAGVRTIVFTRNTGSMVQANAEDLLDAMQYKNTASTPTNGSRVFTINARNAAFESPDAIMTATISCVSISGNIYHDANGLSDGTVNANGTQGQFLANGAYAVLVNPANNNVMATVGIAAGGAYSFGRVDTGKYYIYLSNTATPGTTLSTATYPAGGYKSIGENLGATSGNDLSVDGRLYVKVGSLAVTNANIGVEVPPATTDSTKSGIANPGGYNYYTPGAGAFKATDDDGTVDSMVITSFPTGANYLKVGTTYYTNPLGGTCPPQASCTAWPGSVRLLYSAAGTIAVDPASNGDTTVVIPFTVLDNGNMGSNNGVSSSVTLGFIAQVSPISVSGNVWNDANRSATKDGTEAYTAIASGGQTLYAILVQTSDTYSGASTIYGYTPITAAALGYTFSNVPSGSSYEVRIASLASAPSVGAAVSSFTPALATGWTAVSTNNNGTTATYSTWTSNPTISLGTVSASKTNVNFGIEQTPTADVKAFTAPNSAFTKNNTITIGGFASYGIAANSASLTGSAQKCLSGNDPEDCATTSSCNSGKTFIVKTINANTLLYYDFGSGPVAVATNTSIPNFTLANLTIYGQRGQGYTAPTALGFTYVLVDNASMPSPPVAYSIQTSTTPLPLGLISFDAVAEGCSAILNWKSAAEPGGNYYAVEQSSNGSDFRAVAIVSCAKSGSSYTAKAEGLSARNYFRLKRMAIDGSFDYSETIALTAKACGTAAVMVSPNPVRDHLSINGLVGAGNRVMLYNSLGSLVYTAIATQPSESIGMTAYPAGTYLVQVIGADGTMLSATSVVKE